MLQKLYAVFIIIMIFFLNRYFIRLNRITPYTIYVNNDSITGKDFFLSSEVISIKIADITDLRGGVFEGKSRGMMRITAGEKEMVFYHSLPNADKFEAYLISKVNREIYDRVVKLLKERQALKK